VHLHHCEISLVLLVGLLRLRLQASPIPSHPSLAAANEKETRSNVSAKRRAAHQNSRTTRLHLHQQCHPYQVERLSRLLVLDNLLPNHGRERMTPDQDKLRIPPVIASLHPAPHYGAKHHGTASCPSDKYPSRRALKVTPYGTTSTRTSRLLDTNRTMLSLAEDVQPHVQLGTRSRLFATGSSSSRNIGGRPHTIACSQSKVDGTSHRIASACSYECVLQSGVALSQRAIAEPNHYLESRWVSSALGP
jgi:hypothetical protein